MLGLLDAEGLGDLNEALGEGEIETDGLGLLDALALLDIEANEPTLATENTDGLDLPPDGLS